ncbi:hypothetical protein [Clostridium celatum]|uniref:hypothetical protein n=1 Tax=Clostridium celatum TaxID=36834 RepID=UPI002910BDFD|nr:hypothetical protein [Clostridium celatum]MDU3723960.1 hypothetical protein [Clostridium celatum]MDU6296702.1 hypothetical protein [Clostridium celatum]
MSDNLKEKVKCTIPIKVNSYEELFREFDYRDVKDRSINADLDGWIQEYILRIPYKLRKIYVELEVNMPAEVKDKNKEEVSKVSIINSYREFLAREKKLSFMGVIRICYYIIAAAILLSCWYVIKNSKGESLLTSLLNSGGTVLLWETMTLIFIESKNFKYKVRVNKKLSNMDIVFRYIE